MCAGAIISGNSCLATFVSAITLSVSTGSVVYVSEESKSLLVKDILFLSNFLLVILHDAKRLRTKSSFSADMCGLFSWNS
jgi:hypothetical protein